MWDSELVYAMSQGSHHKPRFFPCLPSIPFNINSGRTGPLGEGERVIGIHKAAELLASFHIFRGRRREIRGENRAMGEVEKKEPEG